MTTLNTQIQPIPNLNASGMQISKASTTTLTVAAGQMRDSSDSFDIVIPSALTLNIAVNGANGLDTGTIAASTMYSVWAIAQSTNPGTSAMGTSFVAPATILSLALTTSTASTVPVLPANYDIYRRIGWAYIDSGSHVVLVYQTGSGSTREYWFDAMMPTELTSGSPGTSATYANVSLAQVLPAIDNLPVILWPVFTPNAANDKCYIIPGGSTATTIPTINGQVASVAISPEFATISKLVTGVPNVTYKLSTASASLALSVVGFVDYI